MSSPVSSDKGKTNGMSEASLFESIAHETRIRTLFLLQSGSPGFSELKRKLGITSSRNLQHHINKLGVLIRLNADSQYALTGNGREAILAIQSIRSMQDRLKLNMNAMIVIGTLIHYVILMNTPFLMGTVDPLMPLNALVSSIAFGAIFYIVWSAAFRVMINEKAESATWIKSEK